MKKFLACTTFILATILFTNLTRESGAENYHFTENAQNPNAFSIENDAHRFRADLDEKSLKISGIENDFRFDWQLKSIGRAETQINLETVKTTKRENRIEIAKSAIQNPQSKILTEWFQNQPDGLEQGFIVHEKPSGDEKLRLVLTTDSIAKAIDDGQSLELSNKENGRIMRYENLKVWDAENTILRAAMRVEDSGEISLEVEDRQAVYPVTIDPKFVQAERILPNAIGSGFGETFDVSGNRMVVGAPSFDNGEGYAVLLVRNSNGWVPVQPLSITPQVEARYGASVAIDGNTIVIGEPFRNSERGAAYVWKFNGTSFVLAQTLTAPDGVDEHQFGTSVAIQGNTIIVGAPGGIDLQGAYVFRDPGAGAFVFRKKLIPSNPINLEGFAEQIAYSGNTIAVRGGRSSGTTLSESNLGNNHREVFVFAGSDTNWTQQARLASPSPQPLGFGSSIDIDGNTLVIGEANEFLPTGIPGKAHIYLRNGTFWVHQQEISLTGSAASEYFGSDVAVEGNTIAVSETGNQDGIGTVHLYARTGNAWRERQRLTAADAYPEQGFGKNLRIVDNRLFATTYDRNQSSQSPIYVFRLERHAPADFDGDGKSDIGVYRPSSGTWYFLRSQAGFGYFQLGLAGDVPATGDYDGDGQTDIAVFRPAEATWYGLFSSTNTIESTHFGMPDDTPVPGDYDGDGTTDVAVFRPSEGVWYWQNSSDGEMVSEMFGSSSDVVVPGDYDGDGITDKAIFRPSNGNWWIARSAFGVAVFTFGVGTDKPAPADYTGDGKTDIAVFRPTTGEWFVLRSENNSYYSYPFGQNGDLPAPADFDGDGRTDTSIFRPSNGTWYLLQSDIGFGAVRFGLVGDKPISRLPF